MRGKTLVNWIPWVSDITYHQPASTEPIAEYRHSIFGIIYQSTIPALFSCYGVPFQPPQAVPTHFPLRPPSSLTNAFILPYPTYSVTSNLSFLLALPFRLNEACLECLFMQGSPSTQTMEQVGTWLAKALSENSCFLSSLFTAVLPGASDGRSCHH
jgi:hypothetical protein